MIGSSTLAIAISGAPTITGNDQKLMLFNLAERRVVGKMVDGLFHRSTGQDFDQFISGLLGQCNS